MVTLTITLLTLGFAFTLLLVGFLLSKQSGIGSYIILSGFLLLMIQGLFLFGSPLSFKTSETLETVYVYGTEYDSYHYDGYNVSAPPQVNDLNLFHTIETISYTNTPDDSLLSYTFNIILLLIGLAGLISYSGYMREQTRKEIENE